MRQPFTREFPGSTQARNYLGRRPIDDGALQHDQNSNQDDNRSVITLCLHSHIVWVYLECLIVNIMAEHSKRSTSHNAGDASQSEGNETIPDYLADYNLNRPIQPIRGMRQGLPNYGDPHFALFLRKVFIKALGYSEDALSRPIIGIINTYSAFNPCHANVPQLMEAAKRGVQLSGGLAMEFPTISVHESFSTPTSMFLRNLMSMDTEEMIKAQPVDACIVIGGKTLF